MRGLTIFFCGLVLLASSGAKAEAVDFSKAFAAKFEDILREADHPDCIGDLKGSQRKLTFIGIPDNNIYINAFQRARLNARMFDVVGKTGRFQSSNSQELGFAAQLAQTSAKGHEKLSKTIDALMQKAPFMFIVKTKRPFKNIAQLELTLHTRAKDGQFSCIKNRLLYVGLAGDKNLQAIPDNELNVDKAGTFFSLNTAHDYLFQQSARWFSRAKRVQARFQFGDFPANCRLKKALPADFRKSFYDVRDELVKTLSYRAGEWPVYNEGDGAKALAKEAVQFNVTYEPGGEPDLVDVTFDVVGAEGTLHSESLSMIVPEGKRRHCLKEKVVVQKKIKPKASPRPDPEPKKLILTARKQNYRQGERLELMIETKVSCKLSLINMDDKGVSCVLYPHKAYKSVNLNLKAGERISFPPKGYLSLDEPGKNTFVAMCNARPSDVQTVLSTYYQHDCAKRRREEVVTIVTGKSPPESGARRTTREADKPYVRDTIVINILGWDETEKGGR